MFCTKCGKEIDDSAAFCIYCGAPVSSAANTAQGVSQPNSIPQYGAPQQFGVVNLYLAPNVIDLINKILRGAVAIVGLLVLIGSIGTLGTTASMLSNPFAGLLKLKTLYNFMVLLRVSSIITFILTLGGAAFTFLTKQRSLFSYISAGLGTLIFIFHFIVFGADAVGAVITFCIFLILFSIALIGASAVIALNKEDIIKFKPKF